MHGTGSCLTNEAACSEKERRAPLGDAYGLKDHRVAESLQAADQVALNGLAVLLVGIVDAALLVDARRISQQVIDDAQDGMAHGDGGPLFVASRCQASVLGLQRGPCGAARRLRRLGQRSAPPRAALARFPTALLTGALVVPRAHPCP